MSAVTTGVSAAPFAVCIDFKNPHAFFANEPTWALANELNVEPEWIPFIVPALVPALPASPHQDRGARHRRLRAAYVEADLLRYARVRGLTLIDPYRNPDSTTAGVALLWVNQQVNAIRQRFVSAAFDAYWRGQLDLADVAALRAVIVGAGGNVDGFETYVAGAGKAALVRWQSRLNEAGLFGVPAYLVGDEVFYGRAHLPMVRWLLTGKQGTPPI